MNIDDEKNIDPIHELLSLTHKKSNLHEWGFTESFRSAVDKRLIYNSEWCRIKLVWGGWDYGSGNSISIYYGRLHAPNENVTMLWNSEECHAWHGFEFGLHFLDGRSQAEIAKVNYSPPLISKFYEEEISQQFYRRQPEWLMQMHSEVWNYYGKRFFELFDLRQAELWLKYREFLKEIYDIKGRPSFIQPPLDKVC
jgi:hypothetical protein